nr:hypothetical protein HK105_003946 [Polyrhizophydium stewartii]
MREEIASLAPFKKLQWSTLEAIELLSTPLEKRIATSWGECFDTRSPTVTWINDIEKDSRYRSLPKSIREVARPSYPGQLKLVRKNLFSLVVMVDLTNAEHHAIITSVLGFVEGNVPLRFGFVFLPDEGQELDHPDGVTAEAVRAAFHKASGKSYSAVIEGRDLKNSELVLKLISLAERLGVSRQSGAMFGNGKHIDIAEGWQQELIQTYFAMIEYMKNLVYLGQLTDETDIYELFMTMDNVYPKRNPFVFPSATNVAEFVNWATLPGIEAIEALPWLQAHSKSTPSETTLILFGDFASMDGVRFALAAADAVATSTRSVRLSFVHNAADRSRSEDAVLVDEVAKHFHDAESGLDGFRSALKAAIVAGSAHFGEEFAAPEFRGLRSHALQPLLAESDAMPGQFGVVAGARIITPLSANQLFDSNDFMSLLTFEASSRNANLASRIALMRKGLDSTFSVGMPEFASIHISAIINPASHDGQKAAAILRSISGLSHVAIEVFLAPQEGNGSDKLPIQRFYRYLLKTEPTFDAYGVFSVVGAWLVRPTRSVYDLDNIKLSSLSPDAVARGVEAEFVLQSILVEGHARDSASNGPPRGLQFVLGTPSEPNMVDTITMANLGYLQLKANPGVWLLQIRDGRSREIYELESVRYASSRGIANVPLVHGSDGVPNSGALIVVDSFTGVTIFPRVHKRLGKEAEDVLQPAPTGVAGMWDKVKNKVTNTLGLKRSETINIFSVASGHLYERFLSIMMLSVKRQTRSPVKFWLIENFLSPSFMEFLPHLAKTFRFEYELVTYKWPKWLREQSEKQRIIWGYKILFLDVLFPLKLDKVIFVDADQVVRADLKELADMDLDGAVYGYTPFCSDRTEMDGFRFWNHGYWKEHLQGKPYHISALYVVDLVKFRELAAGDRLRQQYHMLSADPNSLANLDQDLPNNMIHQLPIFSLPQEWLWCETWCSDYSLRKAKTIDLCNNPMTKEPKLERARRILPEWEGLDRQVQRVRDEFESARKQAAPAAAASTSVSDGSGGHSEL